MANANVSRSWVGPADTGLRLGPAFWLAVLALFVATNVVIELASDWAVWGGELRGTDSYMRLLRVTHLYESGDWYDAAIPRSNAPYGEILHWTRPADLLYLAGALALEPAFGFQRGLFLWAIFLGPLLHVAMVMVLVWAVRPVFDRERRFLLVLAAIAQIAIWPHGLLGRTDHHMLILLVFAAAFGGAWRILLGDRRPAVALAAGAAAGFGLWLSVEFLLVWAVLFAAFGVAWLRAGGDLARGALWHALGLAAVVALALPVERPPGAWWAVEFDRISVVHLLVGGLAAAFWAAADRLSGAGRLAATAERRLLLGALGAAAAGGVMLLAFPKFFAGPEVDFDPGLRDIFLEVVSETQPMWPTSLRSTGWLLIFLGAGVFALPYLLVRLWRDRDQAAWPFWLAIALGLLAYLPAALEMRRFSAFPAVLMAVVIADLLAALLDRVRGTGLARRLLVLAVAVPAIFFAPLAVGGALMSAGQGGVAGACPIGPLIGALNRPDGLGAAPLTVLANINLGPRLMYDTPHRVVTTPYPRNAAGQIDAYQIYAATDLAAARRIVERRGIDLIVACAGMPTYGWLSDAPDTLDTALRRGSVPPWLEPVDLGPDASRHFRAYRAVPAAP